MNDFSQYSNRLQFHFWLIFCGQKVNFKWRSYQADRPLVSSFGIQLPWDEMQELERDVMCFNHCNWDFWRSKN